MLRVGYVLKRFPRLSETFVLNELLELERQGVEVVVFSLLRPPEEPRHQRLAELRAVVHYLPGGSLLDAWQIARVVPGGRTTKQPLVSMLQHTGWPALFNGKTADEVAGLHVKAQTVALLARRYGLDHLHAHFGSDATTVAQLAGRLCELPTSFTAHARDIYHRYTDAERDAAMRRAKLGAASFVVTVSEFNRRHLQTLAAGTQATIHRLYNGVDLAALQASTAPREPGRFVAVGRLIEKKGFRDLVEAAGLLARTGRAFHLEIIGEGPDRADLEAAIAAHGLAGRVELPGAMTHEAVLERIGRASAMVLPCVTGASGDRDGLPTVLLEALATGTPAITTDLGGMEEIVQHGVCGLLVPQSTPLALTDAMARLVDDPALAARMGEAGRIRAEALFDLSANVAELRGLFARSQTAIEERSADAYRLSVG